MAIPAGTKFHGVAPFVDTDNKGSEQANAMRDAYTIEQIASAANSGAIQTITPYLINASSGGCSVYDTDYNMSYITWTGGAGTYDLTLPSAVANPYRLIRVVTHSALSANNKVDVYSPGSEQIDGGAFYRINKAYNGIAVWSDGTDWIVIQAKAT